MQIRILYDCENAAPSQKLQINYFELSRQSPDLVRELEYTFGLRCLNVTLPVRMITDFGMHLVSSAASDC